LEGVPDGPFGYHVQQAIEKLFKALLCQRYVQFKFTHDLDDLVQLLKSEGEILPEAALNLKRIGDFAVTHRYDDIPEFHVLDRAAAIATVRLIREHVVGRIAALAAAPETPPV
jgi:HEPN domain-containing protein